jgi:hypothetical protein
VLGFSLCQGIRQRVYYVNHSRIIRRSV